MSSEGTRSGPAVVAVVVAVELFALECPSMGDAPRLARLREQIADLERRGRAVRSGREAALQRDAGALSAAVEVVPGGMGETLLSEVRCGDDAGLVLVVAEGNYKDDATWLASAVVAAAFADELEPKLGAECDVPPALRRAVLAAHDGIVALGEEPIEAGRYGTSLGPRTTLRGIATSFACAFVVAHRAWVTWVGECSVWLLRGGEARRLSQPHTLRHQPGTTSVDASFMDVPVRLLGFGEASFDVTRLDVEPGDRLVVNHSDAISERVVAVAGSAATRSAAELCGELLRANGSEPGSATVGVVAATWASST